MRGLFTEAAANEDRNISLLIAIGIMFFLENLMTVLWTGNPRSITTPYTSFVVRFAGIGIPFTRFTGFIMALLAAGVVVLFLKKTFIGTAVRAASEDIVSATLMGISPHRVNAVAFAIGIGLAGIAGVDMATIYPFDPFYGFIFVLRGMVALAIGGIGSVDGRPARRHHPRAYREPLILLRPRRVDGRHSLFGIPDRPDVEARRPARAVGEKGIT